jgi:hypothetical protein
MIEGDDGSCRAEFVLTAAVRNRPIAGSLDRKALFVVNRS